MIPISQSFSDLIEQCSTRHSHLCPRQVLGLRMALAGGAALGLDLPRRDKEMLVIAETDGCFVSGLEVAAGVAVGHRTLRVVDYGKIAATFANTRTGEAVRIAPRRDVRLRAQEYAPEEERHYFAQLYGYQRMPDDVLFSITPVVLAPPVESLVSRAGVRVNCCVCGEEIINERELVYQGKVYCRSCLEQGYYQIVLASCAGEKNLIPSPSPF
jgi:formylmethanofuran dehydrogenase subunit E